jgi:hypothetical protein
VIDEVEERDQARQAGRDDGGDRELGHRGVDPSQHGQAVDEGEDHQAQAHPDGPVGQDRGDDPRRQVGARDLDGDEEDREDEDHEGEDGSHEAGHHGPRPLGSEAEERPARHGVEAAHGRRHDEREGEAEDGDDPEGRRQEDPQPVALEPGQ